VWDESYTSSGTSGYPLAPCRIAIDSAANIYATRGGYYSSNGADSMWTTLKYTAH